MILRCFLCLYVIFEFLYKSRLSNFFSEAGRTWREALQGRYALAMSDSGAITTVVPLTTHEKFSSLRYTLSEGNNWNRAKFSDAEVTIDAVLSEPGKILRYRLD